MLGIADISYLLGDETISNLERLEEFDTDEFFIREKAGIVSVKQKLESQETSDLASAAVRNLMAENNIDPADIECLIVISQNPDGFGLPHMSAVMHDNLGLTDGCACFDVSLGCSGFVYGLSVITGFMNSNGFQCGVLVTADNYSKVIDPSDKATALLFGDGVAATLISNNPLWSLGTFDFGTIGKLRKGLEIREDRTLFMDGREIYSFSAKQVPPSILRMLERNDCTLEDVDKIILHQGSKFIVDTIAKRLNATDKTAFYAADYGNTVSSSIPIVLSENLEPTDRRVVVSGFGVGVSWASTILNRCR